MPQLFATLEVLGSSVEKAGTARYLKDDLELKKVKNRNLETRASSTGKALADEQQKNQELITQHKQELKKVEDELQNHKEKAIAREKEFTNEASEIINRFMDMSIFKKRMVAEFTAGGIFYRRECIDARVDVKPSEGEDFDLNELDPEPPAIIRELDLFQLKEDTRKKADEDEKQAEEQTAKK